MSTNGNVNISLAKVLSKETLLLMCLASQFEIIESRILIVRLPCTKVKCKLRLYFPEAITTNMQNGNDFFVLKYAVT